VFSSNLFSLFFPLKFRPIPPPTHHISSYLYHSYGLSDYWAEFCSSPPPEVIFPPFSIFKVFVYALILDAFSPSLVGHSFRAGRFPFAFLSRFLSFIFSLLFILVPPKGLYHLLLYRNALCSGCSPIVLMIRLLCFLYAPLKEPGAAWVSMPLFPPPSLLPVPFLLPPPRFCTPPRKGNKLRLI